MGNSPGRLRTLALAGAAGLVLTITGLTGSTALASDSSCPAGSLCIWEGANYTGTKHVDPERSECTYLGYGAQSAKNYSDSLANFWVGEDCIFSGTWNDVLRPGEVSPRLDVPTAWSISSYIY